MRLLLSILALVSVSAMAFSQELEWIQNPDNGKYYLLVQELLTLEQSKLNAFTYSGRLLSIQDESEQTWLENNLFPRIQSDFAYIGLEPQNDSWIWNGEERANFFNWQNGQPNNEGGNETAVVVDRDGLWLDFNADPLLQSIIEFDPNVISFDEFSPFHIMNFQPIDFYVPDGFIPPESNHSDGTGMIIYLRPGQGVMLQANQPVSIPEGELAYLSASIHCPTESVEAALIAFESPIEGNFGFVNPIRSEIPVDEWQRMELVYPARTGSIVPAMQFILRDSAPEGLYTIYVDNLTVSTYIEPTLTDVRLQGDGSFDTTNRFLVGLNPNAFVALNEDPGFIELTDGRTEQGVRFLLEPNDQAANVALFSIAPEMPTMIHGSVQVKREASDQGSVAFVITDSDQTVCYFIQVKDIPVDEFMELRVGGNFRIGDKITPPIGVFQLGGPGVSSSVIIDDMKLFTSQ